jgi:hypothetical protein
MMKYKAFQACMQEIFLNTQERGDFGKYQFTLADKRLNRIARNHLMTGFKSITHPARFMGVRIWM